jgi:hypothetical protein
MKHKSENYDKNHKIIREVIVIIIILIISTLLSIPSYLSQVKEYNRSKHEDMKKSNSEKLKISAGILKSADKYID